ncbi:hypothetical protein B7R87_16805 [Streptomyces tsukubensis]|uniref:Uncharacterized protein n=1 Tax=Streptomyces tsukubensis (strain DSM 42081 / NBRC 108919 / NRRL 18488 / 9993) TaxID=1114943 RepID=I2N2F7_STRT9|nr:hypothetical protein B7R87_16805 [Streptomyces tsukubensis]EIF91204.1 hypothetical protein [Streptomyces tsukubensis NRRL18488]QKM68620.1 hypothetical protein STSU_016990 [Streptomyces tsukubensis NRRL18488]TAI43426.1 hypothetical protein EWI31_16750 [Streptomyces tsukubensis]
MRDLIVQAFSWALHMLLPARGRHRGPSRSAAASTYSIPPSPWSRPWTGPSSDTARSIFTADEARSLTQEQRERFYATAWAELGCDYPYLAEGVHQVPAEVHA